MEEDEDDIYGSTAPTTTNNAHSASIKSESAAQDGDNAMDVVEDNDEEDGEEYEDSDSDVNIIIDGDDQDAKQPPRPDSSKPGEADRGAQEASAKAKPQTESAKRKQQAQGRSVTPPKSGLEYPEFRNSSVDVNAVPTYEPVGKPITDVSFDADLAEHDKPWRRPGTDQSEYFNYGFDEFTWTLYCEKQKMTRQGVKQQNADFQMMMGGAGPAGMPGMPGMMGGPQAGQQQQQPQQAQAQQQMPTGMPDMSSDAMNKMMSMMMSQGIDPSQMDYNSFMQMYQQMQGQGGGGAQQGYGAQSQAQYGGGMMDTSGQQGAAGNRHMMGNNNYGGGRRGRGKW